MTMNNIQLCVDFGLVILIWMVQLIVYPSFLHYNKANLKNWHQKYTRRIAVIVIPLMLSQLFFAVFNFVIKQDYYTTFYGLGVIFLWVFTLLSFAPLHFNINSTSFKENILKKLIRLNWIRTLMWTLIFILSVLFLPI